MRPTEAEKVAEKVAVAGPNSSQIGTKKWATSRNGKGRDFGPLKLCL